MSRKAGLQPIRWVVQVAVAPKARVLHLLESHNLPCALFRLKGDPSNRTVSLPRNDDQNIKLPQL